MNGMAESVAVYFPILVTGVDAGEADRQSSQFTIVHPQVNFHGRNAFKVCMTLGPASTLPPWRRLMLYSVKVHLALKLMLRNSISTGLLAIFK